MLGSPKSTTSLMFSGSGLLQGELNDKKEVMRFGNGGGCRIQDSLSRRFNLRF